MEVTMSTNTSSGAAPVLALEHRHSQIAFQSVDGEQGCVAYPINWDELYNLKGRLLTLIDATFTDPQQRKAQKDVVWRTLRDWMRGIESAAGMDEFGEPPDDA